jgi:hypothetical protein
MRKLVLVAVTICAIGSLAVPGISVAKQSPQPTLSVLDSCPPELPFNFPYKLEVTISALAPGQEVTLSIATSAGIVVFEGTFPANDEGVARLTSFSGYGGLRIISVTAPFVATRSVTLDCVPDVPPLPTSKEQCKNGGWKTFGVFKNQGDCVSFVATKGKNPPGGH